MSVLCIDLDDTLIDTKRLKQDLRTLIARQGKDAARADEAYAAAGRQGLFSPAVFARQLLASSAARRDFVKKFNQLLDEPERYTLPGAKQQLQLLRQSHSLILITFGQRRLQLKKIKQSGLRNYFDDVIITDDATKRRSLRGLQRRYGADVILIDDSALCRATAADLGIPSHANIFFTSHA